MDLRLLELIKMVLVVKRFYNIEVQQTDLLRFNLAMC